MKLWLEINLKFDTLFEGIQTVTNEWSNICTEEFVRTRGELSACPVHSPRSTLHSMRGPTERRRLKKERARIREMNLCRVNVRNMLWLCRKMAITKRTDREKRKVRQCNKLTNRKVHAKDGDHLRYQQCINFIITICFFFVGMTCKISQFIRLAAAAAVVAVVNVENVFALKC